MANIIYIQGITIHVTMNHLSGLLGSGIRGVMR